jgi:Zn-finger nucleic acid-binding protein
MPPDAGSLHCPNCGAAVRGGSGRCPYCQARLATVSCPACFALMFASARYCQACGAARARTEAEEAAPIACPGCRREMRRLTVGAAPMLECGGCDGAWIDADAFERICADREAQTAVLHRFGTGPREAAPIRVQYRPCPRCHKMMNRVNFGRISGAVVDVCKGHGTFLDAGELHQIVTFIVQGGLERARARQLEDLRDQERSLDQAERRAARHYDRTARLDRDQEVLEAFGVTRYSGTLGDLFDLIRGA